MSADDDTFDIDIYGDDEQTQQPLAPEDDVYDGYDLNEDQSNGASKTDNLPLGLPTSSNVKQEGAIKQELPAKPQTHQEPQSTVSPPVQQGTKRKAPDDDESATQPRPPSSTSVSSRTPTTQPGATAALRLAELHWWTTEDDLRRFCARAGVESELRELTFAEHKINGKSRGEVYLAFSSATAASAVKQAIETKEDTSAVPGKRRSDAAKRNANHPYIVDFSPTFNPFKGRDSGVVSRQLATPPGQQQQHSGGRGGAYNNFNNNRGGNYAGRGGGFNNRGGGFSRGGGYQNNMNQPVNASGGGWGMGMGAAGFGNNPMMNMGAMGMGMGMGMGYGNMGRGGSMMMGGRGGGFGAGMGNMANMMRGGGMMGGGRGGWAGGGPGGGMMGMMPQGLPQGLPTFNNMGGAPQSGAQGSYPDPQANKRMRPDDGQ